MRLQSQNLLPPGKADICPPEFRDKRLDIRDKSVEGDEGARTYGRYRNVYLSDVQISELQSEIPTNWESYIERMSEYMESTGKRYLNHAATIRRWANADNKKATPVARNRDYCVKEGETV